MGTTVDALGERTPSATKWTIVSTIQGVYRMSTADRKPFVGGNWKMGVLATHDENRIRPIIPYGIRGVLWEPRAP